MVRFLIAVRLALVALGPSATGHRPSICQRDLAEASAPKSVHTRVQSGMLATRNRPAGNPWASRSRVARTWVRKVAAGVMAPTVALQTSFVPERSVTYPAPWDTAALAWVSVPDISDPD